jgi:hypothetical protein
MFIQAFDEERGRHARTVTKIIRPAPSRPVRACPAYETALANTDLSTVEVKSYAKGGTLWQAENQVAASETTCVNSLR